MKKLESLKKTRMEDYFKCHKEDAIYKRKKKFNFRYGKLK